MAAGKKGRKITIAAAAIVALSGAFAVNARQNCCHQHAAEQKCGPDAAANSKEATRQFDFTVTDIIVKTDDDLVRVCGNLAGRPHTSARIDSITMRGANGVLIKADDIDGVDFERYFQWEDDGIIPLEIDFPGLEKYNTAVGGNEAAEIIFHTAKGEVVLKF